jgi:hypothetical protein
VGEVNAALGSRNLRWKIKYELNLEAPETYRIEPYGYGGGHVTGGDLRGLMYGLLEAADQIRSTGRLALTHAVPAIPSRAVRMFLPNGDLSRQPESFWRAYFQTLARSRLNRFTLVFLSANPYPLLVEVNGTPVEGAAGQRERNLRMLRFISQTAAEYAVDFTLAFWDIANPAEMGQYAHDALLILLAECPAIRSVELRPRSADSVALRETVFKALHEVGRRVALQPRGALLDPALEKAAEEAGVALNVPSKSWPPGFEIDPPPGDGHEIFYWMWGRLGYDPKTKPPYGIVEPEEYRIAAQIVNQLRNALLADPDTYLWPQIHASIAAETAAGSSDFVATIPEAIRNRIGDVASAKQTPLDIADSLSSASVGLEKSSTPDFQLLAELARDHSRRLRAAYWIEMFDQLRNPAALARAQQEMTAGESSSEDLSAIENAIEQRRQATDLDPSKEIPEPLKIPPRPQIAHTPVKIVAADQPITLMLQTNPAKDVRLIRLHYRKLDARDWKTIEKPQAPWTFSIPASDLAPDTQFVYYFEILNRENTGWFEPDPLNAIPYHFVRVEPK